MIIIFQLLHEVLEKNNLLNKPGEIYNMDESGMPLEHRSPHVLARKGQRKVRYRTSGNKSQVTVIGCINAAGQAIPPFVIFDAKSLNMEWTKGEVVGTTYGLSSRGWVDMELFKGWFSDHFLNYAVSARPLLLLLDGHSSHYNPEAIRLAKENDVIMFTLVPHTTHEMQPLDTAVFGPLKTHWREACHDYMQANPGKTINKYNFSSLLNTAWMKAMVPQNIISGFRTCGVYPYKPTAILDHDPCVPQSNPQQESDDIPVNHDDGSSEDIENSEESNRQASNNADETSNWNFSMILPSSLSDESHFERRYEEGYDLHDPEYEAWLNVHHPEALNKCCPAPQSEVIESTSEPQNSVVNFFSDVMLIDELPLQLGDLTSESTVLLSTPHSPMLALSAVIPHDFTSALPSQDSVSVPSPQDCATSPSQPIVTAHSPSLFTSFVPLELSLQDRSLGAMSPTSNSPHSVTPLVNLPLTAHSTSPHVSGMFIATTLCCVTNYLNKHSYACKYSL